MGTVVARGDIKSMKLSLARALSPGFTSEIRLENRSYRRGISSQ
jgi:hypothetical protein